MPDVTLSTPDTSPVTLTGWILLFGFGAIAVMVVGLVRVGASAESMTRGAGMMMLFVAIIFAIAQTRAGFTDTSAAFGMLGTIAGYVVGRYGAEPKGEGEGRGERERPPPRRRADVEDVAADGPAGRERTVEPPEKVH